MAQAHNKNIRRVHDLEDKILCPRAMLTYAFFRGNFFSLHNFFFKFYSVKRRTKGLKLREKRIGHHARLEENNLSLIWPTYPQRKPSRFGLCAR